MGDRREARELVLQGLYQWDQLGPDDGPSSAERHIRDRASRPEIQEYAGALLTTYLSHAIGIDERIEAAAEHWSLSRIAVVDRAILRLAVTEILHRSDVPPKVSIDEAIELAKKYSTEKSSSFVNGILDRILTEKDDSHGPG